MGVCPSHICFDDTDDVPLMNLVMFFQATLKNRRIRSRDHQPTSGTPEGHHWNDPIKTQGGSGIDQLKLGRINIQLLHTYIYIYKYIYKYIYLSLSLCGDIMRYPHLFITIGTDESDEFPSSPIVWGTSSSFHGSPRGVPHWQPSSATTVASASASRGPRWKRSR